MQNMRECNVLGGGKVPVRQLLYHHGQRLQLQELCERIFQDRFDSSIWWKQYIGQEPESLHW
jgi:hypothetical protein